MLISHTMQEPLCSKLANSCFQLILAAIVATITMVKVKLILDVYTWAIVLTN